MTTPVTRIDLDEDSFLIQSKPSIGWVLHHSIHGLMRHLTSFENGFVNSALRAAQLKTVVEPMRKHVEDFATRAGWKREDGEGAFEYVQRVSYAQGLEDAKSLAPRAAARLVSGALFELMGMLTSQPERTQFSDKDDASPAVEQLRKFAAKRGLLLDDPDIQGWHKFTNTIFDGGMNTR